MTKKDYEAIAKCLRNAKTFGSGDSLVYSYEILQDLCDLFLDDNPRFDRVRFMAAVRGEKWSAKRNGKSRNSWQTGETHGVVTDATYGGTRKSVSR